MVFGAHPNSRSLEIQARGIILFLVNAFVYRTRSSIQLDDGPSSGMELLQGACTSQVQYFISIDSALCSHAIIIYSTQEFLRIAAGLVNQTPHGALSQFALPSCHQPTISLTKYPQLFQRFVFIIILFTPNQEVQIWLPNIAGIYKPHSLRVRIRD